MWNDWHGWVRRASVASGAAVTQVQRTDIMDTNHSSGISNVGTSKKPYEKPSFRYEKVFVTTALSCGKISSTDQNCILGGIKSS